MFAANATSLPSAVVPQTAPEERSPGASMDPTSLVGEVEIKFVIVPEGFSHSRRFPRSYSLLEMKAQVEKDLRIPVDSMKLFYEGAEMTLPLLRDYELSMEGPNCVELQIVYIEEHAAPATYIMPGVISVEVQFGVDIPPKLIQVPIVRSGRGKIFLGGYRSRKVHAPSDPQPPFDVVRWRRQPRAAVGAWLPLWPRKRLAPVMLAVAHRVSSRMQPDRSTLPLWCLGIIFQIPP